MGMMFNNRRQSQDKVLREYIINESQSSKLWMNQYSMNQFEEQSTDNIYVDEFFLDKAEENDYCLVENLSLKGYEQKINKIILFKWNRVYPADKYFDIQLSDEWILKNVVEVEGNSHQKITKEEWHCERK